MIVDCHTHAFPDSIAARAIESIGSHGKIRNVLDGTLGSLLGSMDRAGVDRSFLLNIATKPEQFPAIMTFCAASRSDRILPFPSVHPNDPDLKSHLRAIKAEGYKGIKLHSYYQQFVFDEDRLFPLYATLEEEGLCLIAHTGYDIAYPFDDICRPRRIVAVVDRFPGLKLMTSHLGAWMDYEEVRRWFIGRPIYMDISCTFGFLADSEVKDIIEQHGPEYVLFGSDSPWVGQAETLASLRGLGFSPDVLAMIEGKNAQRFFDLPP
jgi:predicted TIM-barrel fold metal-dependent hydrolase